MKDASIKYCIKFARSFFVADVNEADKELSAMQTRIDTLETENERLNKIIHAVEVALRRRLKSGETVYNIISAVQFALESE